MLPSLLFELGHAFELAQRGDAIKNPRQFRMLRDMRLNKDNALVRGQSASNEDTCSLHDPLLHQPHFILDGDGMIVHYGVDTIILVGQANPVADGPHIITDMNVARRLNAAENPIHVLFLTQSRPGIKVP